MGKVNKRNSDRKYRQTEGYKITQMKYRQTEGYKNYQRKYRQTEGFKKSQRKYRQTEGVKKSQRKYRQTEGYKIIRKKSYLNNQQYYKDYRSTHNEYYKDYRSTHKEYYKEYRSTHKEQIQERARKYREMNPQMPGWAVPDREAMMYLIFESTYMRKGKMTLDRLKKSILYVGYSVDSDRPFQHLLEVVNGRCKVAKKDKGLSSLLNRRGTVSIIRDEWTIPVVSRLKEGTVISALRKYGALLNVNGANLGYFFDTTEEEEQAGDEVLERLYERYESTLTELPRFSKDDIGGTRWKRFVETITESMAYGTVDITSMNYMTAMNSTASTDDDGIITEKEDVIDNEEGDGLITEEEDVIDNEEGDGLITEEEDVIDNEDDIKEDHSQKGILDDPETFSYPCEVDSIPVKRFCSLPARLSKRKVIDLENFSVVENAIQNVEIVSSTEKESVKEVENTTEKESVKEVENTTEKESVKEVEITTEKESVKEVEITTEKESVKGEEIITGEKRVEELIIAENESYQDRDHMVISDECVLKEKVLYQQILINNKVKEIENARFVKDEESKQAEKKRNRLEEELISAKKLKKKLLEEQLSKLKNELKKRKEIDQIRWKPY